MQQFAHRVSVQTRGRGLYEITGEIKAWMLGTGMAGVVLAGSGSAWVGCCPDSDVASRARREAGARGWTVFLAEAVPRGWVETNR